MAKNTPAGPEIDANDTMTIRHQTPDWERQPRSIERAINSGRPAAQPADDFGHSIESAINREVSRRNGRS